MHMPLLSVFKGYMIQVITMLVKTYNWNMSSNCCGIYLDAEQKKNKKKKKKKCWSPQSLSMRVLLVLCAIVNTVSSKSICYC